jgi:tetratricopeptide (TPR) repeat protein
MHQGMALDVPKLPAFLRLASTVLLLASGCLSSTVIASKAEAGQAQRASTGGQSTQDNLSSAEAELRTGIELTGRGLFSQAIPHFLSADGHVADEQALRFDLALCYVGTSQFAQAIRTLGLLKATGFDNENVENLLAQAYVGSGQAEEAFESLKRAASFSPKNEKLYVFVADACADRQEFDLGLRVMEFGLIQLPKSSRLHYERGYFLVLLDHWDLAQAEFDQAALLAPQTIIAYLAQAQKFKFAGDLANEIRVAREAVQEGHANFLSLSILGDALIAAGATPGQPEFAEARAALLKALEERPQAAGVQLSLGSLLLMEDQLDSAIQHLEIAKKLAPDNPAIYARLAFAYRKTGNKPAAAVALAALEQLNAQQAEKIRTAPGDRKAINAGGSAVPNTH